MLKKCFDIFFLERRFGGTFLLDMPDVEFWVLFYIKCHLCRYDTKKNRKFLKKMPRLQGKKPTTSDEAKKIDVCNQRTTPA